MKKAFSVFFSILMIISLLTGCSKEVSVDSTGLLHMTLEGTPTAMTKEGYTATLVPDAHFELPETITVTMEDQEAQSYHYDPFTGVLTFTEVTGNITISGTASESIVGTWSGSADFTEALTASLAADPTVASYFNFSEFVLDLTMTFDTEGTCTLAIDAASARESVETIAQEMLDGMLKMITDLLQQMDIDMTAQDYLAATGISIEDLQEQLNAEWDVDELISKISQQGKYLIKDGKLYISDDLESDPEEEDACPYTLASGVLTINAPEDAAEDEAAAYLFPLVLKRVS